MKTNTFLTIVVAISTLLSCNNKQEQYAPSPPVIPVVEVSSRDVQGYTSFPVNIEGKVNNAVRAKISGYIKEVFVDEGQKVSAGQTLFRLETDVQSQNANAARSAINAARANVSAAEASVNAAQVEVDRLIPLVERNVISSVQLETAKANLARAKGQLEQSKAAEQQAIAGLNAIQANMDFAVVKSPVSGVIGTINFREGSLVGPSDPTPITTVSETSEVYAYFSMSEAEYLNFLEETEGKTVKEKLSNLPEVELVLANGKTYDEKGVIKTVTGQIDPSTGTIQFRATFNNSNGILTNGNSGLIKIPQNFEDVLTVPESSTYEQQGIIYVYKVINDTVFSTPVEVSNRVNNVAILTSGLDKGDLVAAKGLGQLRNRAAVTPEKVDFDSIIIIKPVM
ncbi:MAG: efflux RND transporter periplasmic adaptor subunit [Weeksellaceae bacterium]|jgi:membrane fusion protein (multidrug efflux system)|nr:efflux RND transporter periplasmic adaptor subunit [Weeksellaceae bacterium]